MIGLTRLGTIHTAISLVAVGAGFIALARDEAISPINNLGKIYIVATVARCLTAYGIFQHGRFGKPHVLGILTLIVLAIAALARRSGIFGGASPYVETVSYSATYLFNLNSGSDRSRYPPPAWCATGGQRRRSGPAVRHRRAPGTVRGGRCRPGAPPAFEPFAIECLRLVGRKPRPGRRSSAKGVDADATAGGPTGISPGTRKAPRRAPLDPLGSEESGGFPGFPQRIVLTSALVLDRAHDLGLDRGEDLCIGPEGLDE